MFSDCFRQLQTAADTWHVVASIPYAKVKTMPEDKKPLVFSTSVSMRDAVRIKVRSGSTGKPIREIMVGADRHRAADAWIEKERVIDRENDSYVEVVKEEGTGKIIHECRELPTPLSSSDEDHPYL